MHKFGYINSEKYQLQKKKEKENVIASSLIFV